MIIYDLPWWIFESSQIFPEFGQTAPKSSSKTSNSNRATTSGPIVSMKDGAAATSPMVEISGIFILENCGDFQIPNG